MTPEPGKLLEKTYTPGSFESACYQRWLQLDLFRAGKNPSHPPFTIVIPPPNITGNLHVGHALNNTLQDVLVRWRRMQGYDTLWLPGIDHAGIATQMVVERELRRKGTSRHDIGRGKFLEEVWKWKEHHSGAIITTLQRLGCSCDWSRLRFTLDEGLSRAVLQVFVALYEEGLIYRAEALINWCPSCQTALSDLEVDHREESGSLWHVAYPVEGSDRRLVVATTRPETMLGDTAVAVHPDDERYRDLIGGRALLPLLDRPIPIIADAELVDPTFGTGAVKVTPAHDFNDFAAGRRNNLPAITVLREDASINENGGPYAGLDRFEARKRIVDDLREHGLLVKVEDHRLTISVCQRCSTVLEPRLSTQWFVRVAPLAAPALAAVEAGRVEIVPASWKKTYYEWMRNIHDWCISRQLWWGHRIPAWYCPDGHVTVSSGTPAACEACGSSSLSQDEDVLDTWFSSALWPFSTLGWPGKTPDLHRYYPTSVLITGPDILFFWVARMIMMGLKFTGQAPFHTVYLHGLVRDERGQKMSKTRGNVVEPEELLSRYGADAARFTFAVGASPGPSVALGPERLEGYRAFANKIWNAARFVLMNLKEEEGRPALGREELSLPDRWILSSVSRLAGEVGRDLEAFRFDLAASALYHFIWHSYCDWFIELSKPSLTGPAADSRRGRCTRAVLVEVLDTLLRLLHPFMPFLTEELWQRLPQQAGTAPSISTAPFPEEIPQRLDPVAEERIQEMIEIVTRVRNLRAEAGLDPAKRIAVRLSAPSAEALRGAEEFREYLPRLCQAESVELALRDTTGQGGPALRAVADHFDVAIPLTGLVDVSLLGEKLRRDLRKVDSDLAARRRKLDNTEFAGRAPAEVVERERRIAEELGARRRRLSEILADLTSG